MAQAQKYIADGHGWVVDLDLEKFFDRVNHDKLMGKIAQRIGDKRLLKLIRAFLNAGVMENAWSLRVWKEPRKGDRSRRCSAISCSTSSTASWRTAGIALFDMRTTVISTFAANERGSG